MRVGRLRLLTPVIALLVATPALGDAESTSDELTFRLHSFGRLRLEAEQGRDFTPNTKAFSVLTGRVGGDVSTAWGTFSATVGDGDKLRLPTTGDDVQLDPFRFIFGLTYTLKLGAHDLKVGRFEYRLGDARYISNRPFHPRAHPQDGALYTYRRGAFKTELAGFYLGPHLGESAQPSAVVSGLSSWKSDHLDAEGIAFIHRDGELAAAPVTSGTLGSRFALKGWGAFLKAGLDGQLGVVEEDLTLGPALGAHVEGALGYGTGFNVGLPLKLRASIGGEATFGDAREGFAFRQPEATRHGYLGRLDMFAMDNVAAGIAALTAQLGDALILDAVAYSFARVDRERDVRNAGFVPILAAGEGGNWLMTELDLRARVPLTPHLGLDFIYGLGVPHDDALSRVVIQRALFTLVFIADGIFVPDA